MRYRLERADDGTVIAHDMTLSDAVRAALTHDGREFSALAEDDGHCTVHYTLMTRHPPLQKYWRPTFCCVAVSSSKSASKIPQPPDELIEDKLLGQAFIMYYANGKTTDNLRICEDV